MVFRAEPVFSPRPWGDTSLNKAFDVETDEPVGEVWLLSDMPSMTTVLRTDDTVKTPAEIVEDFAGRPLPRFPLLIKLISATSWLSFQVHPDDDMARKEEGEPWGKSECWYFLSDSKIAAGLCQSQLIDGDLSVGEDSLNYLFPHAGDAICIEPGLVHAIGPGTRLLEIQQASDLTYRLFDWGRDRELHIEKGRRAVKPHLKPVIIKTARKVANNMFSIEMVDRAAGTGIMVTMGSTPTLSVLIDDEISLEEEFMWIKIGNYWKELSV